jgi:hypothetical protein
MSHAEGAAIKAILRIAQGQGKARYTEFRRLSWCTPILSTSHVSLRALMKKFGNNEDLAAYVDRLMEIPSPLPHCFFEDLHGYADVAEYCAALDHLAGHHHGIIGPAFAAHFARFLASDRVRLERRFLAYRDYYLRFARAIANSQRDLTRVHGRCATIYASGRLAIDFGVFPIDERELLHDILVCERAHVGFIARESGAAKALEQLPFDRLKDYLKKGHLVDLKNGLPANHDPQRCPGYTTVYEGRREFWLPNNRFEKIAGGKPEANALKQELNQRGLIASVRRGNSVSLVVKRPIPGFGRPYVVALTPKTQVNAKRD